MSRKLNPDQAAEYLAELVVAGELGPMDEEWVDRVSEEPWFQSHLPLDQFLQSLFPGTHAGPWSTSWVMPDQAAEWLLKYGELWVEPVFWEMEIGRCHQNIKCLYETGKIDEVWTGIALTSDGMWRSHSWGMRLVYDPTTHEPSWEVVETTVPRIMYFGVPDPEYFEEPGSEELAVLPYFT